MKNISLLIDDTEIDEIEWLKAATTNPAFNFLNESTEDIYSLNDGIVFKIKSPNKIDDKSLKVESESR